MNAAVSGTESRPLSQTILNPWTQGEKYDPHGEYIKKWIPELSVVPKEDAQHLHQWDKYGEHYKSKLKRNYPYKPIVDYEKEKKINIQLYKKAKKN